MLAVATPASSVDLPLLLAILSADSEPRFSYLAFLPLIHVIGLVVPLPALHCGGGGYTEDYERECGSETGAPAEAAPAEALERTPGERTQAAIDSWRNVYSKAPCTDTIHRMQRGTVGEGRYVVVTMDGHEVLVGMDDVYPELYAKVLNEELDVLYRTHGRKSLSVPDAFGCQ